MKKLEQYGFVDEDHGIMKHTEDKRCVYRCVADYDMKYCYLLALMRKEKRQKLVMNLLIGTSIDIPEYILWFGRSNKRRTS